MNEIELKNPTLRRRKTGCFSVEIIIKSQNSLWVFPYFHVYYFKNEKITRQTETRWLRKFLESSHFNFKPRRLSDGCISKGFTSEEYASLPQALEKVDWTKYISQVTHQLKHKRKKGKKYV